MCSCYCLWYHWQTVYKYNRTIINTKICLSNTGYHPESWSPFWNVSNILIGSVFKIRGDRLPKAYRDKVGFIVFKEEQNKRPFR